MKVAPVWSISPCLAGENINSSSTSRRRSRRRSDPSSRHRRGGGGDRMGKTSESSKSSESITLNRKSSERSWQASSKE